MAEAVKIVQKDNRRPIYAANYITIKLLSTQPIYMTIIHSYIYSCERRNVFTSK